MLLLVFGCESTYYDAMEKIGVHKRDILIDRIEDAQSAQEDGQEQFKDALTQFRAVVNFDGGELEDYYDELNDEYEDSVSAAETIRDRVNAVESVAEALFDEWQEELEKYTNETLKRDSLRKLKDTQRRYNSLLNAMRKAESKMAPVLSALRDNVLYLKHNLNASAIGALQGEFNGIKKEINQLVSEMNKAIAESNSFISSMKSQ